MLPVSANQLRVAQLAGSTGNALMRNYPSALPCLLDAAAARTGIAVAPEPVLISSFIDERLAECPMLYINWDDRNDWEEFSDAEIGALRKYLENGGMCFVDAGITAAFLRGPDGRAQHHSFPEWQENPAVHQFFARVLPEESFLPVLRTDPLFSCCYQGLPDAALLPPTVKQYTVEEKWPDGTYAAVAIRLNGHIAVLATPVIAMGWGRNSRGGWQTQIRLRVLEGSDDLGSMLQEAAYSGQRFEVTREDGGTDVVFCQEEALPAWTREPNGNWRVFRYYDSRQIDDFTHVFYTRLGINIFTAALLGI